MTRFRASVARVVCAVVLPVGAVLAQGPSLVTEFGVLSAVSGAGKTHGSPLNTLFWEAGALLPGAGATRLGATLYVSYDDTSWRKILVGVKGRVRHTLPSGLAVELSGGPLLGGDTEGGAPMGRMPGATGRLDVSYKGRVGLVAGVDWIRLDYPDDYGPGRRQGSTTALFGLKLGGGYGMIAGVLGAVGTAIITSIPD